MTRTEAFDAGEGEDGRMSTPAGPPVRALLLDADGVVQYPELGWTGQLDDLGGSPGFFRDVSAAELRALTGEADLAELVGDLIDSRGLDVTFAELLAIWCRIELDPVMVKLVGRVRDAGLVTALATNQQSYRGTYMQQAFGYQDLFDRTFYSFEVGLRKPDPAYFRTVVDALGVRPEEAVFVDDMLANVLGAREAGLRAVLFPATDTHGHLRLKLRAAGVPGV
jgi:putative hydrolase of the HAD superfamily